MATDSFPDVVDLASRFAVSDGLPNVGSDGPLPSAVHAALLHVWWPGGSDRRRPYGGQVDPKFESLALEAQFEVTFAAIGRVLHRIQKWEWDLVMLYSIHRFTRAKPGQPFHVFLKKSLIAPQAQPPHRPLGNREFRKWLDRYLLRDLDNAREARDVFVHRFVVDKAAALDSGSAGRWDVYCEVQRLRVFFEGQIARLQQEIDRQLDALGLAGEVDKMNHDEEVAVRQFALELLERRGNRLARHYRTAGSAVLLGEDPVPLDGFLGNLPDGT